MPPERQALLALAESIADGAPLDWDAAEARASAEERGVVRQLRLLSELAMLHRSLPANPADWPGVRQPRRGLTAPAIGSWGHLALLERLGGGTSGDVYRAWDPQLEREVALKLLRAGETQHDPEQSRITREGRLLARVRHANVITVYGVSTHDGRVAMWMELVRGETLEQILARRGAFSAREAALIGVDLCRALAAIHGAGLIHRDVKAQNVMREDGGRIVLMDFGTGRELAATVSNTTDIAGTPLYLAPELFRGEAASVRSDIYSLGVLLYRLVTARYPVDAATFDELRDAHAARTVARLRDVRADLPPAFVQVVERAIDSDPRRRYESAGAFEADLVRALEARGPDTAAMPVPDTGAPKVRQTLPRWLPAKAAAVVLLGILAAAILSFSVWRSTGPRTAGGPIRSIAVLPLANLSGDASQEYFADGMTDELISTLGRIQGLDVISRTSVMQFKGTTTPVSEIARRLAVDAVLEGSVLVVPALGDANKPARSVRVQARLIAAGTDTQLWNRGFEALLGDALALQGQIAGAIADGLDFHLTHQQQQALKRGTAPAATSEQAADALDLYLKGRHYWNMRTEDALKQSVRYFQEAIERHPSFARAHAGLADAFSRLGINSFLPADDAFARAEASAKKALEIEPALGEAHASLALVHMERLEWDPAAAHFQRALTGSPGYASAHHWYSAYLAISGNLSGALAAIERARALDPLSHSVAVQRAAILILSRRANEATSVLERIAAENPAAPRTHALLALSYAQQGSYDRALAEAKTAADLGDRSPELKATSGYIHARMNRRTEALAIADGLAENDRRGERGAAGAAALVYANLGHSNRAFELLDRGRRVRDPWIAYLKVDPRWDALRNDARFETLLVGVELPR